MINRIQLLRNLGSFDSVDTGTQIPFSRLTLIYAENGKGKTTLAAVLRSLQSGNPIHIEERRRLAAQHAPHIVLECSGDPPTAIFQNGAWNRQFPNLAIFDDYFVDQNVYSGLSVDSEHRQNLHELIIGDRAVALNQRLQELVQRIELHNATLRERAAVIPTAALAGMTVDNFCALPLIENIDQSIANDERLLAAIREATPVRSTPAFDELTLPPFDVVTLEQLLQEDLPNLEITAAAKVQQHIETLGAGGEQWVSQGVRRLPEGLTGECPFCAQDLNASPVIGHYRAYFSDAYTDLKRRVTAFRAQVNEIHGNNKPAIFERSVRVAIERRQFWSRFCVLPELAVDTAGIVQDWQAALEAVETVLAQKQASLLERVPLTEAARQAINAYEIHRNGILALNAALQQTNNVIGAVKAQAAQGNVNEITARLARSSAVRARHSTAIDALCRNYLLEKIAKTETERLRDETRREFDTQRKELFATYGEEVNRNLELFNAGFRLGQVAPTQTRAGATCTYNVIINNTAVPVGGATNPGHPSFRTTLSAGDRNTLALAFFLASIAQDPTSPDKVVVIDDPMSSLDEHRSLTTVQCIRRLVLQVAQVLVLSHSRPFLCNIWESADPTNRTALSVVSGGAGSTLQVWTVADDCITEHDRRYRMCRDFLDGNTAINPRDVAEALRPSLEAFLRVACPQHFPPGKLLGPFRNTCRQRLNNGTPILDATTLQELEDLTEYANRFHHDANPAWQTANINNVELQGFTRRTLEFMKP